MQHESCFCPLRGNRREGRPYTRSMIWIDLRVCKLDILISLSSLNCVLVLTQSSLFLKATSIAHTQVRERPVRVPSPVCELIIALKHWIDNTEAPKTPNQTQHLPLLALQQRFICLNQAIPTYVPPQRTPNLFFLACYAIIDARQPLRYGKWHPFWWSFGNCS